MTTRRAGGKSDEPSFGVDRYFSLDVFDKDVVAAIKNTSVSVQDFVKHLN
jgi:hypothetical protein